MSFIDEYYYPLENATMGYRCIDRYIHRIFPSKDFKNDMEFEERIAIETEIKIIRSKTVSVPGFPLVERDFDDCSLEVKSLVFQCMRITNIGKALIILNKYDSGCMAESIERLTFMKDILQSEYWEWDGHNEYYSPLLDSMREYRNVQGLRLSFPEYLAYCDLQKYFSDTANVSSHFFADNVQDLFMYMAGIYLGIEIGMEEQELCRYLDEQRDKMDFLQYYNISTAVKELIASMKEELMQFKNRINMTVISQKLKTRRVFALRYAEADDNMETGDFKIIIPDKT